MFKFIWVVCLETLQCLQSCTECFNVSTISYKITSFMTVYFGFLCLCGRKAQPKHDIAGLWYLDFCQNVASISKFNIYSFFIHTALLLGLKFYSTLTIQAFRLARFLTIKSALYKISSKLEFKPISMKRQHACGCRKNATQLFFFQRTIITPVCVFSGRNPHEQKLPPLLMCWSVYPKL